MLKILDHGYIAATILLTVYSQLILRWQMPLVGSAPDALSEKVLFLVCVLFRPWVFSALVATFLAGVSWMAALSRFPLSYAFPFMGLNFVLIMISSAIFFAEPLTTGKALGNILIVIGIIVLAQTHEYQG